MRAAVVTEIGQPPEVGDRPEPELDDDLVLLDMEAVALNPVDIAIASGSFYAGHPPPPYIPCLEGVGRTREGRLVYAQGVGRGIAVDGFAAERVAVPSSILTEVPDDLDPGVAAAVGTAGLAGWLSVIWRGGVKPGDRVVVLGASGAVGNIALQAARAGARVLVVRNTVNAAIETWRAVLSEDPSVCFEVAGEPTLHHSRFAAEEWFRSRICQM